MRGCTFHKYTFSFSFSRVFTLTTPFFFPPAKATWARYFAFYLQKLHIVECKLKISMPKVSSSKDYWLPFPLYSSNSVLFICHTACMRYCLIQGPDFLIRILHLAVSESVSDNLWTPLLTNQTDSVLEKSMDNFLCVAAWCMFSMMKWYSPKSSSFCRC